MYCRASATLWIRSSCLMTVIVPPRAEEKGNVWGQSPQHHYRNSCARHLNNSPLRHLFSVFRRFRGHLLHDGRVGRSNGAQEIAVVGGFAAAGRAPLVAGRGADGALAVVRVVSV